MTAASQAQILQQDGARIALPYLNRREITVKGRWFGRLLLEVLSSEFPSCTSEGWKERLRLGWVQLNGVVATGDEILRPRSRIVTLEHRHEPPVLVPDAVLPLQSAQTSCEAQQGHSHGSMNASSGSSQAASSDGSPDSLAPSASSSSPHSPPPELGLWLRGYDLIDGVTVPTHWPLLPAMSAPTLPTAAAAAAADGACSSMTAQAPASAPLVSPPPAYIVVCKPPSWPVHPAGAYCRNTLLEALTAQLEAVKGQAKQSQASLTVQVEQAHLQHRGACATAFSGTPPPPPPAPPSAAAVDLSVLHRLDRLVSGLVVFATNRPAAQAFQSALEDKSDAAVTAGGSAISPAHGLVASCSSAGLAIRAELSAGFQRKKCRSAGGIASGVCQGELPFPVPSTAGSVAESTVIAAGVSAIAFTPSKRGREAGEGTHFPSPSVPLIAATAFTPSAPLIAADGDDLKTSAGSAACKSPAESPPEAFSEAPSEACGKASESAASLQHAASLKKAYVARLLGRLDAAAIAARLTAEIGMSEEAAGVALPSSVGVSSAANSDAAAAGASLAASGATGHVSAAMANGGVRVRLFASWRHALAGLPVLCEEEELSADDKALSSEMGSTEANCAAAMDGASAGAAGISVHCDLSAPPPAVLSRLPVEPSSHPSLPSLLAPLSAAGCELLPPSIIDVAFPIGPVQGRPGVFQAILPTDPSRRNLARGGGVSNAGWPSNAVSGSLAESALQEPLSAITPPAERDTAAATTASKPAQTEVYPLAYDPVTDTTFVLLQPVTGRTHQLRIHVQALGYPIALDGDYGPLIPATRPLVKQAHVSGGGTAPLRPSLGDWARRFSLPDTCRSSSIPFLLAHLEQQSGESGEAAAVIASCPFCAKLRTRSAGLAGGVGEADGLTVTPHQAAEGAAAAHGVTTGSRACPSPAITTSSGSPVPACAGPPAADPEPTGQHAAVSQLTAPLHHGGVGAPAEEKAAAAAESPAFVGAIMLHALAYAGAGFAFSVPLPVWWG